MTLGEGAVHYWGPEEPGGLVLEAEHIELDYSWEEGRTLRSPWQEDFQETTSNQDQESEPFSNVTLTTQPVEDPTEVLVYPQDGTLDISASGTGDLSYDRLDTEYVTQVGVPSDAGSTNDSQTIGFWYQPATRWMTGGGADEATVRGNFSLFLNNMTVTVEQDGETAWQNWTGYREQDTGPGASSYERRLLQVHVTSGTLSLAEDDGVTVLGPTLEVDANGIVTAGTATGRLQLEETTFAFEEEPLRLEGEGRFQVTESSTDTPGGLGLSVGERSEFNVQGGERMDRGPMGSVALAGWSTWIPASMLGLLLAGAVAHKAGYTREALQRWRSGRYTKWMTRGRELANAADYGQAATCFRRAARAQPAKGVAWYHLAISLLEDERPGEALDVVTEAREGEAIIDELDFLDLEAQAARRAGDHERCRAAVARLADGSEAMARTLVRDLGLSEELLGHQLATRLSWEEDEEGLPGYV